MPESKRRRNRKKGQRANDQSEASPLSSAEPFDFPDLDADEEETARWYVATMVALLVAGLLWLVVYYVSSARMPIPGIGGWNVVIGFGVMMSGMFMSMKWK